MPLQQTQTVSQPTAPSGSRPAVNNLLARLPRDVQQRLQSHCTRVTLETEALLTEAGSSLSWVYLPCRGLVSLQTMTQNGETVEVAMVGNEGIVGLPFATESTLAPHTAIVLIPGESLRMRADALQAEFERSTPLQRALVQYWTVLMTEIAQGSACHRFHTARQRLARWLLAASDRTQTARIELTQERLAQVLGIQRTWVTVASVALQDAGAIKSRHGRITIIDRRRLESLTCECYRLS